MDTYNQEIFREYVLTHTSDLYQIEEINDSEKTVTYLAANHTVFIKFYFNEIVELYIRRNGSQDNLYYLHFVCNDKAYCEEQFNEMKKFFVDLVNEKVTKIMLTCSSGMTTSLFALKLNEMAEIMKLDYKFDACNYKSIVERSIESSVVLVAPQIAHETKWIKEVIPDKLVIDIPTNIFAAMKTAEMMDIIRVEIYKKEKEKNTIKPVTIETILDNNFKILTIGIERILNTVHYPCCIIDHGKVVFEEEIIKTDYRQNDIDGILDYITSLHKDLDAISIAQPGVTYHGFIGDINQDVEIIDFATKYTVKYGVQVFLCNDANAMALGYHAMHKDTDNMLFYYQPFLSAMGGGGLISNGALVRGHLSVAGEMAAAIMMMEPNYEELKKTREGAERLVTSAILSYIVTVGPEKVVIASKMMPEAEKIKSLLSTHINRLFVPQIITTNDIKNNMLTGLMVYALESLNKDYKKIASEIKEMGVEVKTIPEMDKIMERLKSKNKQ